jgi:hypothetical protein
VDIITQMGITVTFYLTGTAVTLYLTDNEIAQEIEMPLSHPADDEYRGVEC